MNEELKKYAEMLISMSTDYLMGSYDEKLYIKMIDMANKNIQKL